MADSRSEQNGIPEQKGAPASKGVLWFKRVGWLIAIWIASVLALATAAYLMRGLMHLIGLSTSA